MRLFIVWVHLLAAVVWVGGMIFMTMVVGPYARRLPPEQRGELSDQLGRRFSIAGWACVAVLLLTGIGNLIQRGMEWSPAFARALGVKLLLVGFMVLLTALHDFIFGPRSAVAAADPTKATEAEAARVRASWVAHINLVLALIVLLLGLRLSGT
jgi:uncharacterized membrane protein